MQTWSASFNLDISTWSSFPMSWTICRNIQARVHGPNACCGFLGELHAHAAVHVRGCLGDSRAAWFPRAAFGGPVERSAASGMFLDGGIGMKILRSALILFGLCLAVQAQTPR